MVISIVQVRSPMRIFGGQPVALTPVVGPLDIVCCSADAVQKIMGAGSPCTKRGMGVFEIFDHHGGFSLEAVLDTDTHRARRQIWDRAQNSQGIRLNSCYCG